jgi:hypothetical protein
MSMDRIIREQARLIMLRELAVQPNYALNDSLLAATLEAFGVYRPREWVRDEMRWLETMGAVGITEVSAEAGTVLIATLKPKGRDHVEHRLLIEGVKRPGPRE